MGIKDVFQKYTTQFTEKLWETQVGFDMFRQEGLEEAEMLQAK